MVTPRARPLILRRGAEHPLAAVSVSVLVLLSAVLIAASLVALTADHGDALLRVVQGARSSLLAALLGVSVSVVVGTVCGLAAGIYARNFSAFLGWVAYATASVPALIFLVVVLAYSSRSLTGAVVLFGVLLSVPNFRLARNTVVSLGHQATARTRRAEDRTALRLLWRGVFPALRRELFALALLESSLLLGVHFLLGFLGLEGATEPSLGALLREHLQNGPGPASWAPSALFLLALAALAVLGGSIRRVQRPSGPIETLVVAVEDEEDGADEPQPSLWFRSSAVLDVRGLRIRSGPKPESPEIVCGVSLTITQGEIVGLLGDANSGAHEIALAIAGLPAPRTRVSGGSILFDGTELVGLPERSLTRLRGTGVSYLPRDPLASLDPAFTVASHLQTPLRKTLGLSRLAATAHSLELLRRVGFSDPQAILALLPGQLTPIMAQRVLIAGAISCEPMLLVAHEPTATLSQPDDAALLESLRSLQQELGLTVIVVTDSVQLVAAICRQVAVVQAGMIVEHASIADLLGAPRHEYTRHLLLADSAR